MIYKNDKKHNKINRICDHEGCTKEGTHRAPKNRNLNEYYWFCLEHVTEYNKNWNFYGDLSAEEIEKHIKNDTTWQRPTWKLGESAKHNYTQSTIKDDFGVFSDIGMGMDGKHNPPQNNENSISDELASAIRFLRVTLPLDIKEVKKQYKLLAKEYHPDKNKNDTKSESMFKQLNAHYTYLIKYIENK